MDSQSSAPQLVPIPPVDIIIFGATGDLSLRKIVLDKPIGKNLEAARQVNDKRVERLWRCEGLKVPIKQPKRGRLRFGWPGLATSSI